MPHRRRIDWRKSAAALGAAIPRDRLHREVLEWMAHRAPADRWHIALSGGADSVALLLLLWTHWPERRRRLRALHFDHRLRGAASRDDAKFCQRLCRALGLRITVGRWQRARAAAPPSEAESRAARMDFFEQHARVLWLGHHQDDVAESMLMRLARGSGSAGLAAPRPVQRMGRGRVHLRPMLDLRKQDIVAALRASGASWREDATNGAPDFFRNRIRRDVLPRWEKAARRDAVAGAARSRQLLAEDDTALEHWLDTLSPFSKSGELLLSRLIGKPNALWRRALHRLFLRSPLRIDVSRQAFESLLTAAQRQAPTRHSLGREMFGVIRAGRLRLEAGKPGSKFQRRVN